MLRARSERARNSSCAPGLTFGVYNIIGFKRSPRSTGSAPENLEYYKRIFLRPPKIVKPCEVFKWFGVCEVFRELLSRTIAVAIIGPLVWSCWSQAHRSNTHGSPKTSYVYINYLVGVLQAQKDVHHAVWLLPPTSRLGALEPGSS